MVSVSQMACVVSSEPVHQAAQMALVDTAVCVASENPLISVVSEDLMPLEVSAYLPVVLEVSLDPGVSMMAMKISEEA